MDNLEKNICLITILQKLNTSNLLRLKEVNKKLCFNIRQSMEHFEIKCNNRIRDHRLDALAGVRIIDLSYCCSITDQGLKALAYSSRFIHTIDLRNCYKITDNGLKALADANRFIHTIDLSGTYIMDDGLKALVSTNTSIHEISLRFCKITDDGLKSLIGIHTIDICGCTNITDDGIKPLAGLENINISGSQITEEGLDVLKKAKPDVFIYCYP